MAKEFDYYIYIDHSEDFLGYIIIEKSKVRELLQKTSKLHHFKDIKHKKEYLHAIKNRIEKEHIKEILLKWKVKKVYFNLDLFTDIFEFLNKNDNCLIFLSLDDNQYDAFIKLLNLTSKRENIVIIKESSLKKDSVEYKLSLILDNMLNIERKSLENKT